MNISSSGSTPQQQELLPHVDADLRSNEILKMKQNLYMRTATGTLRTSQQISTSSSSDPMFNENPSSSSSSYLTSVPGYQNHHRRSSSSFQDSLGPPLPTLVKNGGRNPNNNNSSSSDNNHHQFSPRRTNYIHPTLLLMRNDEDTSPVLTRTSDGDIVIRSDDDYNNGSPNSRNDDRMLSHRESDKMRINPKEFPQRVNFGNGKDNKKRVNEFDDEIVLRSQSSERELIGEERHLQRIEGNLDMMNHHEDSSPLETTSSRKANNNHEKLIDFASVDWKPSTSAAMNHEKTRINTLFPNQVSSLSQLQQGNQEEEQNLLRQKYRAELLNREKFQVPHPQEFPKIQDPFETLRGISNRPLMNATSVLRKAGGTSSSYHADDYTNNNIHHHQSPRATTSPSPLSGARTIEEHIWNTGESNRKLRQEELIRQRAHHQQEVALGDEDNNDINYDDDERQGEAHHPSHQEQHVVDGSVAAVVPSMAWTRESFSSQQRQRVNENAKTFEESGREARQAELNAQEERIRREREKKDQLEGYSQSILVDLPVIISGDGEEGEGKNQNDDDDDDAPPSFQNIMPSFTAAAAKAPSSLNSVSEQQHQPFIEHLRAKQHQERVFVDEERCDPREVHDLVDRSERRRRKKELFDALMREDDNNNTTEQQQQHAPTAYFDVNDIERITYNDDDDDDVMGLEDTSFLYDNSNNSKNKSQMKLSSPRRQKNSQSPQQPSFASREQDYKTASSFDHDEDNNNNSNRHHFNDDQYLKNPPKNPQFDDYEDIPDDMRLQQRNNKYADPLLSMTPIINRENNNNDGDDGDEERKHDNERGSPPSLLDRIQNKMREHISPSAVQQDNINNNNNDEQQLSKKKSLKDLVGKKIMLPRAEAKAEAGLLRFKKQVEEASAADDNHVNDLFVKRAREMGIVNGDNNDDQTTQQPPNRPEFTSDFLFTTPAKKFAGYNQEKGTDYVAPAVTTPLSLDFNNNHSSRNAESSILPFASKVMSGATAKQRPDHSERRRPSDHQTTSSPTKLFRRQSTNSDNSNNNNNNNNNKNNSSPGKQEERQQQHRPSGNSSSSSPPSSIQQQQPIHNNNTHQSTKSSIDSLFAKSPDRNDREQEQQRVNKEEPQKQKSPNEARPIPLSETLDDHNRGEEERVNQKGELMIDQRKLLQAGLPNQHPPDIQVVNDDSSNNNTNNKQDSQQQHQPAKKELLQVPSLLDSDVSSSSPTMKQQTTGTPNADTDDTVGDTNKDATPSVASPSSPPAQQQQRPPLSNSFEMIEPEAKSISLRECRQTAAITEKLHRLRRNPSYIRPCKQRIVALWKDYILIYEEDADPESLPCEVPLRLITTTTAGGGGALSTSSAASPPLPSLSVTPATSPTFAASPTTTTVTNASSPTLSVTSASSTGGGSGMYMPLPITTREDPLTNKNVPSAVKWPLCIGYWKNTTTPKEKEQHSQTSVSSPTASAVAAASPTKTTGKNDNEGENNNNNSPIVLSFASRSHRDQWQDALVTMQKRSIRRQRILASNRQLAQQEQQERQEMQLHQQQRDKQREDLMNSLPSLISATLALAANQQKGNNNNNNNNNENSSSNTNSRSASVSNNKKNRSGSEKQSSGDGIMMSDEHSLNSTRRQDNNNDNDDNSSSDLLTPQQTAVVKNVLKLWRK